MKTIQEKRLDFINSEFQPYIDNAKLRGIAPNGYCKYLDKSTGNKCLIGKQIPEGKYNSKLEGTPISYNDELFNILPKEIQELGRDFLSDLQYLHDNLGYWTPNFNKEGQQALENKIKNYCTNI